MRIYLDIDGVILGTASPQEDVCALLEALLRRFPGEVCWLTTHCRGGENRTWRALAGRLPQALLDRLKEEVLPTDWDVLKTEAIDLGEPFLWLEDAPLYSEREALRRAGREDCLLLMNPKDPASARKALERIRAESGAGGHSSAQESPSGRKR